MVHARDSQERPHGPAPLAAGGPSPAGGAERGRHGKGPRGPALAMLVAVLHLGVAVLLGPAVARAETLSPERVQTLRLKFQSARTIAASIDARARCLLVFRNDLQVGGEALDVLIGEQTREIERLRVEVVQVEEQIRQINRTIDEQNAQQAAMEREWEAKRKAHEDHLARCRRWSLIPHTCWSAGLTPAGVVFQLGDPRLLGAHERFDIPNSLRPVDITKAQLTQTEAQLKVTLERRSASMAEKKRSEDKMVQVQSLLASVTSLQIHSVDVADEILHHVEDGDDMVSSNPEYIATLLKVAGEIDGLTSRAPALIHAADVVLPEATRRACSLDTP